LPFTQTWEALRKNPRVLENKRDKKPFGQRKLSFPGKRLVVPRDREKMGSIAKGRRQKAMMFFTGTWSF
jgi:hypothetical protein